jgi:predicted ATPase with chaperone activity
VWRNAVWKCGRDSRRSDRASTKVARTIADLAAAENLSASHVAEAIGYLRLDRAG